MWIRETGSEGPWKFFSWISFCITNELHLFFPQSFQMSAVWHKLLYHAWNMFILNWKQVIFSVSSLSPLNKWFFFTAIILCCYLFNTRVPEGIESNAKILRFFYHQLNCRTETHFPSCWADCQITRYISAPFIKNVLSWRKLVHPRLSRLPDAVHIQWLINMHDIEWADYLPQFRPIVQGHLISRTPCVTLSFAAVLQWLW